MNNATKSSDFDWSTLPSILDPAMDQLKPEYREVLLLRFFQGVPAATIANLIGGSRTSVDARVERAMTALSLQLGLSATPADRSVLLSQILLQAAGKPVPARLATNILKRVIEQKIEPARGV